MAISGLGAGSFVTTSYGHGNASKYIPKSYEEIKAERNGEAYWFHSLSAEEKKSMTLEELKAWSKENAPKQETAAGDLSQLTEEEIARLSGRYQHGMSGQELDELLVELLDMGAITEQDRNIALGMRPVDENLMGTDAIMVHYEESVSFDDFHNQDDLYGYLQRYETLLWKQSKALEYENRDYSMHRDVRASCQRLMEIIDAIR